MLQEPGDLSVDPRAGYDDDPPYGSWILGPLYPTDGFEKVEKQRVGESQALTARLLALPLPIELNPH